MPLQKRTLDDDSTFELIDDVCRRPHMFYANAESLRDVVALIDGISCGMNPPHGCLRLSEFVSGVFHLSDSLPWTTVVLAELGNLPFYDGGEALAKLFRDFRSTVRPAPPPN